MVLPGPVSPSEPGHRWFAEGAVARISIALCLMHSRPSLMNVLALRHHEVMNLMMRALNHYAHEARAPSA